MYGHTDNISSISQSQLQATLQNILLAHQIKAKKSFLKGLRKHDA